MNSKFQTIFDIIQQSKKLDAEQKDTLLKAVKDADKELEITVFKLERTEKVKKTTAILLEETIEELEQKRKAVEEQNRELEIEASLERVRAVAMGMNKSEDLLSICKISFKEFKRLGFDNLRNAVIHMLNDEKRFFVDYDYSDYLGGSIININYNSHPVVENYLKQIKKADDAFAEVIVEGKELDSWKDFRRSGGQHDDPRLDGIPALYYYLYSIGAGDIGISTLSPINESQIKILRRFRNVFDLAYRRYNDIALAETQAREAQVEAALERVRSRTMGMLKSEELKEVIQVVYEQFVQLNIFIEHTGFIMDYKTRDDMNIWLADQHEVPFQVTIPYFDSAHWNSFNEAKEKGLDFFVNHLTFEEKNRFYQTLFEHIPDVPEETKKYYFSCPGLAVSTVLLENVGLYIENFSGIPYSDEENNTLMRFGKVFQQTYTRFNDLQKAEEQAREAQIEASLEKVRSSAMAMHNSNDISSTTTVIFEELKKLNIKSKRCGVALLSGNSFMGHVYAAATSSEGKFLTLRRSIDMTQHQSLQQQYESWKKQENYFIEMNGDELKSYYQLPFFYSSPDYVPPANYERTEYGYYIPFSEGLFYAWTESLYSEIEINILNRFKSIIELTFRRFFDLLKAEAQAREAQIEAALERVRAKAMAMHSSKDLDDTIGAFYTELKSLGVIPRRCGVALINKETRMAEVSTMNTTEQGDSVGVIGKIKMTGHLILENIFDNWLLQKEYHTELRGNQIKEYYQVLHPQISYPDYPNDVVQFGYYFMFKEGDVYAWTDKELIEEELKIFRRFTTVINLTYKRYIELQQAEAQAKEAIKQTSLDRIRGEIASMRTADDLNRITPIVWRELKTLEVPFIRCGVFIVNEEEERVQVYLTTPDGKSLGVLHLSFDSNELTRNTVEHWKKNIVYKEYWNKDDFINWTKSMIEIGQVQNAETYQGSSEPPESLDLHFIPFTQGMLYVGDVNPLTDEKLELVKTLAEAFSIAYARYEDFKNLEEAKNKIELTLKELKAAQAQLIHSEKMASLGVLTAGIAHEIKNPLNFVNNFSDLSKELIEDVKTELENNNNEEVLALLEDLKQNLEKINQHGKRADSIVKGMLLHSRGSSGEKTISDLNYLLDQYVNLAYHGMRAQNKEFNITIEKDYDESIQKINVVPQDISRVFLNIINNAGYAAYDRKKKSGDNNFSPTLKVSTKNLKDKVEIRIGDNGNGIPADHLDKIFQPFFTTKPTGEGTGLGLSLSYDIVTKVHGGELKVETKINKGSEFIIQLPLY